MAAFEEYTDPRQANLYDAINTFGPDTAFYIDLAARLDARTIIDIGCGTGLLAHELSTRGHHVTGVDPSSAMLDVARHRDKGEQVRWIHGDATRLAEEGADLVVMTGHVAQVISDDDEWRATLAAAHRALRPGGHVAFESRNPAGQPWAAWTPDVSRRRVHVGTDAGEIDVWYRLLNATDRLVHFEYHLTLLNTGEDLVSHNTLRFRTQAELTRAVFDAGFVLQDVFGDWGREPVKASGRELIVVAARP